MRWTPRSLLARLSPPRPTPRPRRAALRVESLEDRTVPVAMPAVSLTVPPTGFIGKAIPLAVTFSNTGQVGYAPFAQVILPATGADGDDGLAFVPGSATYLGSPVTTSVVTLNGAGRANNPFAHDAAGAPLVVNGTPGDQVVFFQLPFGSFVTGQPGATIDFRAALSNKADLGVPLNVTAVGGFALGNDPLDNAATDPPILSGSQVAALTPSLFTVTKRYIGPENETATGPNYPRQYVVELSVAPGQTLTTVDLTDFLPANVQFVSVGAVSGNGSTTTTATATPSIAVPGGTLIRTLDRVVGTGGIDASMAFTFFIPLDAGGGPVLNPTTGAPVTSVNNASGASNWTPIDPRDVAGPVSQNAPPVTIQDQSLVTQKSVVPIDPVTGLPNPTLPIKPGLVLQYTLAYQVSDFFGFDNVHLNDVIGDGLVFDTTFAPTLSSQSKGQTTTGVFAPANFTVSDPLVPAPQTTQTVNFDVSSELAGRGPSGFGGLLLGGSVPVGGTGGGPPSSTPSSTATIGTVTFRARVLTDFRVLASAASNSAIKQGDILNNDVTVGGGVLNVADLSPTGNTASDDSAAPVQVARGALTKGIYAINGNTAFGAPRITAGDTVTYRVTYTLPIGRVESLKLTDYLPLPVFDATTVTTFDDVTNGTAPAAGHAQFGPASNYRTLFSAPGEAPTLSSDAPTNTVVFTFPTDLIESASSSVTVEVLFTVTATNLPFADGLFLTNQARAGETSTNNGSVVADAIVGVTLTEPHLVVRKGVVSTDNPAAVFAPGTPAPVPFAAPGAAAPAFTGTINDTNLAAIPIDSNLSNLQATDRVKFAIVVQNNGSGLNGAFDTLIRDTLPAGFHLPSTGLNLNVVNGAGSPLTFTTVGTGLFDPAGGVQLDDIPAGDFPARGALTAADPASGTNIAVITYDLQADAPSDVAPVQSGQTLTNTAAVAGYASDEGGPNFLAAPITDPANVTIQTPATAKSLMSTSIVDATNSATEAVVGEIVTYRLTATFPQGISPNVRIVDTMPAGLAFLDLDPGFTTTISAGLTLTGGTTPTVTSSGQTVTFDLGNVTNTTTDSATPETVTVQYRAVVLNVAGNIRNQTLQNSARLTFNGTNTPIARAPAVTVIVPQVNTTKSVDVNGVANGTGDAGDPVDYTIVLSNPISATTTAYNVTFADPIPAAILGPTLTSVSGAATAADFAIVAGSVVTTDPNGITLLPGQTVTLVVHGTLASSVGPDQLIVNTATTSYTSLPGSPGVISPFNANSTEGAYSGNGSASFRTRSLGPVKAIVATSEASTTGSDVVVGEIVRYRLYTRIGEGQTTALQFADSMPAGLAFVDDGTAKVLFVADGGGITSDAFAGAGLSTVGDETTLDTLTPTFVLPSSAIAGGPFGDGSDPAFNLGTLTNADRDANVEFAVVEFNARVVNVASNQAGVGLDNSFITFENGVNKGTSGPASLTVREPLLVTTKTATPINGLSGGDTIAYTVTVQNTGPVTAFDVAIRDPLAAALTAVVGSLVVTPGAAVTASGLAGNIVAVDLSMIAPGDTVTITYSVKLSNAIGPLQVIPNTATSSFTSLPASGTGANPTGTNAGTAGTTDGERNGTTDGERNGTGGVNDYTTNAAASLTTAAPRILTKTVVSTSNPATAGTVLTPGESVTYRVAFTLPNETFATLVLNDLLPAGLTYVSSRLVSVGGNATAGATGSGTVGTGIQTSPLAVGAAGTFAAGTVSFNFNGLVNAADGQIDALDQILLDVTGRVDATVPAASTLTNAATLDFGTGTLTGTTDITTTNPSLQITKATGTTRADAGDIVTYAVTVKHAAASDGPAFDLTIADILQPGLQLVPGSVTSTDGTVTTGNGPADTTVAVSIPQLNIADTVLITYQARVTAVPVPGAALPNTATLGFDTFPGPGGTAGTASANATVRVNANSISGIVYNDANNDGEFRSGETSIPGVSVQLIGTDHLGNPVNITVVTGAGGTYTFPSLRPGSYRIVETQPAGFLDGKDTPGTEFGGASLPPTGDTITGIIIPPGSNAAAIDYNFGERAAADLAVTKTVSNARPNVGDTITYTVTLTNNGPSTATAISVADALPIGLTFVSATPSVGTYSAATGTWSVASLANGASATLAIQATVVSPNPTTNTSVVSAAAQFDTNPNNNRADAIVTPQRADLAVSKRVSSTAPNVGDLITYTVTLSNNGPDAATNVTVGDSLPAGIAFVSTSDPAYDSATGVWTVGTLASGATRTLTITATVTAANPPANVAAVTRSDQFDPVVANNTATAVLAPPQADLVTTKAVSNARPNVGDFITYTVRVRNAGPNAATNVVVNDPPPAGLADVIRISVTPGNYDPVTGVWAIGTLAPRQVATLTYRALVTGPLPQTNAATASADQADPTPANNTARQTITPRQADLALTKTVNNPTPNANGLVAFTVTLRNNGADAATHVTVADALPAGLTFVSAVPSRGTYRAATGVWTVGTVPAGATRTLVINARVTGSTPRTNAAAVSHSDQFDPVLINNTASATVAPKLADIQVLKSVSNPRPNVGDTVTFTVTARNNGPDTATRVVLNDVLPAGLVRLSAMPSAGAYSTVSGNWSIPTLANGAAATLTFTARVTGHTPTRNTARVTRLDQFDTDANNDRATADVTPRQADLAVSKTVSAAAPAIGDVITYTIALTNNGPDAATGVTLSDPLPAGVVFQTAVPSRGTYTAATGVWDVGTVGVGESVTLAITARVTRGRPAANVVRVRHSDQFDPVVANNVATAAIGQPRADLRLLKTVSNATPNVGDTIAYTVTVTNDGPDAATNVRVTDKLPAGLTFVSATPAAAYNATTGVWTVGGLANGATATLTLRARVADAATHLNVATASALQFDPDPTNNTAGVLETPRQADLSVAKDVGNARPNVGDTIAYRLVVKNNGPDAATNVRVVDKLPVGLTFVSATPAAAYNATTGVWTIGGLANGATATLFITARVVATTTVTNVAVVTADQYDPVPANNTDAAPETPQHADLLVRKTVDVATPFLNDRVTFTVEVTNNGPDAATNVRVTDRLPAGLTFVSAAPEGGTYDPVTGVWTVGTVPAGATRRLRVTVTVTTPLPVRNIATAIGDQFDPVAANNGAAAGVAAHAADVSVRKIASAPIVGLGTVVTFTYIVSNNGPDAATNVRMNDILPAGLAFVRTVSVGRGTYNSGTRVWTIGTIARGETLRLVIQYRVTRFGRLVNTAIVAADEFDPVLNNNAAAVAIFGVPVGKGGFLGGNP